MSDSLIFNEEPTIHVASNRFIGIPTILMFEDTPLLEVEQIPEAGFTTKYSIYHSDGTYLAKVVGSRLFLTKDGDKAGLTLRHPAGMTVCELAGKTLFEIRRLEAAALKTEAELYSPAGTFIRASDAGLDWFKLVAGQDALKIGGLTVRGNTFTGWDVGIRVHADGRVGLGVKLPRA